jgi:PBP1b-binding outer membrane lipoprotein LpoB
MKTTRLGLCLCVMAMAFVLNGCAAGEVKTDAKVQNQDDKVQMAMDMHDENFMSPTARHR